MVKLEQVRHSPCKERVCLKKVLIRWTEVCNQECLITYSDCWTHSKRIIQRTNTWSHATILKSTMSRLWISSLKISMMEIQSWHSCLSEKIWKKEFMLKIFVKKHQIRQRMQLIYSSEVIGSIFFWFYQEISCNLIVDQLNAYLASSFFIKINLSECSSIYYFSCCIKVLLLDTLAQLKWTQIQVGPIQCSLLISSLKSQQMGWSMWRTRSYILSI